MCLREKMMVHAHFVTKISFVFVMIGIRLAGLVFNIFNMVDFADKSEELKFYRNLMIVKKNPNNYHHFLHTSCLL